MTQKTRIIDVLGEDSLLLPQRVNDGLAANDRAKYYLTLLQEAVANAAAPREDAPDLERERLACGLDEVELDRVVAGSSDEGDGVARVPMAGELCRRTVVEVERMLAPLETIDDPAARAATARLEKLRAALPAVTAERIRSADVAAMTSAQRAAGDSIHLLVMDLHKELNRLQGSIAEDAIGGALVYGLDEGDGTLVAAFMNGLNATAPLKFDHPGLDATATRDGDRLVIQNDIGTTDAHVLVVHVEGLTTTIQYTDIHVQRAEFFQRLFEPFGVEWEDTRARRARGLAESDKYFLCVGTHHAADDAELHRYLEFLGSRVVFLIDWNKARKRLRKLVRKRDALALLDWAAAERWGHRGFLTLGGQALIFEAMEYASEMPLRHGERLCDILGDEAAAEYLRFVLRTAASGLLADRSERLIRDEVKTELLSYFNRAQLGLLALAARHAALIFELASVVRDGLVSVSHDPRPRLKRVARRAASWESKADEVVSRARDSRRWSSTASPWLAMVEEADDAADSLEESAFLLTLLSRDDRSERLFRPLIALGGLLVDGAQEFVKACACAGHVHQGGQRDDLKDLLEAVDRVFHIEHETDDVHREVTAALVRDAADFRQLYVYSAIARSLEEAADSLMRSALMLRDQMLLEVRGDGGR